PCRVRQVVSRGRFSVQPIRGEGMSALAGLCLTGPESIESNVIKMARTRPRHAERVALGVGPGPLADRPAKGNRRLLEKIPHGQGADHRNRGSLGRSHLSWFMRVGTLADSATSVPAP